MTVAPGSAVRESCDRYPTGAERVTVPAADFARVRAFAHMMTERRGNDLDQWLTGAENTGLKPLRSLARGLRQDFDAVTAGLTLEWSSGRVEGNVNRVKRIKRDGYGRAGFDLLRRQILLAD